MAPLDRSRPPQPGPIRPCPFPPFERRPLADGLTLMAAAVERMPLTMLELLTPAGAHLDPLDRSGLAGFTADLMDEGTDRWSAVELAARVERLGGALSSGCSWDVAYAYVTLQGRHLDAAIELLSEVVTRPAFSAEEAARVQARRLAELVRRKDQPARLADERLMREIYGATIYGRTVLGEESTLSELGGDDAAAFYRRSYAASDSILLLLGDFEPSQLDELEEAFSGLPAGPPVPRPEPPAPRRDHRRVVIVDRPGAAQTELRIGHPGIERSHPDFLPLRVANTLLGGKFTSRLNLNLRERHGFTYSIHSYVTSRRGRGPLFVATAVSSDVTGRAAREILSEIERLRDEPVTEAELTDTQSYIIGTFPYTLQGIDGLSSRYEELAIHQLPDDYFDRLPEKVAALTAGELQRVAREHLDPDGATVVAVGPAELLERQLRDLGEVSVIGNA